MKIQIITLFPAMFKEVFEASMLRKAQEKDIVQFSCIDLRQYGLGPRKQVDDTPYGGGDGMLLMIEPLHKALQQAKQNDPPARVYLMTPAGKQLNQSALRKLAKQANGMIVICGHYEGYDERITSSVDQQISIGDYILTGGELPAMVFVDGVVRLLPGVLGGENSAEIESFSDGNNIEFPQYTRPEEFEGMKVPSVLLSGDHAKIAKWRDDHSKIA